jgi:hypothetical protein
MGLLDFHADSIERNALARPTGPAPEPTFSAWAATKAMGGGVPAGLMEGLGAVRDFSRGVDEQRAAELKAKEMRTGIPQHQNPMMPGGGSLRKKADEYMPDPLTAHWSAQVLGGFSKSLTKAGTAMVIAGPTGGAAIFGAMEADDTAQRLITKGIDSKTAWQVGGVVGVTSAIGARLPISGAAMATTTAGKVGATAALGVVGGPASYMAQEGLAREILQRAGHADEAKLHDPLNPIGLGASMFPLVLGGIAVRGALRKPLKTEADAKAAAQFTPEEQAKIDAFERSAGNLAELESAIKAEKRPEAKALLVAEMEKQRAALAKGVRETSANRAAADPVAVDAARVKVLDETVSKSLPAEPQAHTLVMRAADMVAAAERVDVEPMISATERQANLTAWFGESKVVGAVGKPAVVYHATGQQFDSFRTEGNTSSGVRLDAAFFSEKPDYSNEYAQVVGGRGQPVHSMPTYLALRNPMQVELSAREFADPRAEASFIEKARAAGHDGVVFKDAETGDKFYAVFDPKNIKSATGNSGRFDPTSASLTDPLPRETVAPRAPEALPSGAQAADQPSASPTTSSEATKSPDAVLAKTLADVNPEIPVRLPGDEKNTTLAAALERIKEEQAADMQMADLYKVATTCFLTGGAAT